MRQSIPGPGTNGHVTLYRLERRLKTHRDTLERLARIAGIAVERCHNVRAIAADDVPELAEAVEIWREQIRPWRRRPAPVGPGRA